jgi:hypothetical protein
MSRSGLGGSFFAVLARLWGWCVDHPDGASLTLAVTGSITMSITLAVLSLITTIDTGLVFAFVLIALLGAWSLHTPWEAAHTQRRISGEDRGANSTPEARN